MVFASPACAQRSVTVDAIEAAKQAIAHNDFALARTILDFLVEHEPQDIETNFLLAELDARQGHLKAASARFQKILYSHPALIRVRLDYALTLFRLHEDDRAEYNFRLALASDLPFQVRQNVLNYLHAIRARRRYQIDVTASVAPDTNINAATGLNEVTLFGLPFTLNQQAREKSGVGAVFSTSGEYRYPISDEVRLRSVASLWRAEYPGGQFDDMILRTELGPQWLRQDWDISVLGVYTQRWYGNDPYDTGAGPRIEVAYHALQRWRLEADAEYLRVGYHTQTFQNGDYATTNFYPTFYLTPTSYLSPIVGFFRQSAAAPSFSFIGYRAGLGYHQEIAYGMTVEAQPELLMSYYGGPNVMFGTTRRDRTVRVALGVYRRDWVVFGFDPVFRYIFTDNSSNQLLYSFRRNQFEIGFTKEF